MRRYVTTRGWTTSLPSPPGCACGVVGGVRRAPSAGPAGEAQDHSAARPSRPRPTDPSGSAAPAPTRSPRPVPTIGRRAQQWQAGGRKRSRGILRTADGAVAAAGRAAADNHIVASRSHWGLTPRQSIEAECGRRGRRAVIAGCAQLLIGADANAAATLIMTLGGGCTHARRRVNPRPGQEGVAPSDQLRTPSGWWAAAADADVLRVRPVDLKGRAKPRHGRFSFVDRGSLFRPGFGRRGMPERIPVGWR
jgi:hypothetical protein